MIPLHGETIGGASGRLIWSALRYIITTCWIFMSVCSMSQSLSQKMARKCWATSIAEVIFPVDVRSLPCMMSSVTFDFAMAPRPSHGPFPWPGQPNSTHTILSHFVYSAGLSDQKLRFSFDLKCVALSVCYSHAQKDWCFTSACLLRGARCTDLCRKGSFLLKRVFLHYNIKEYLYYNILRSLFLLLSPFLQRSLVSSRRTHWCVGVWIAYEY